MQLIALWKHNQQQKGGAKKINQIENKELRKLIQPLLLEQGLIVTTGVVNTVMVAKVGEAAVSAVSLVDMLNFLVITIFTGLSIGGSILSSRFVGENRRDKIPKVYYHLIFIVITCSILFMVIGLIGNVRLLKLVFGNIENEVLMNASQYLEIIVCSFLFLSIYSSSVAILKGLGKFKTSMAISFLMNVINVVGNYLLIYQMNYGITGVAIPTFIARIIAAGLSLVLVIKAMQKGRKTKIKLQFDSRLLKEMLHISIPGCIELSIFQLGKIIVLSLVARLGTNAIAANAIGNMINNVQALPEDAMGIALMTLVSRSLGRNQLEEAKNYIKKIMKLIYQYMFIINVIIFLTANYIVNIFMLTDVTREMTVNIIRFNCLFAVTIWPLAFALPNALKGATDVKYPLVISLSSMWIFRVGLSYIVISFLSANIYMLYLCFAIDWIFRGIMFLKRYLNEKWYIVYQGK